MTAPNDLPAPIRLYLAGFVASRRRLAALRGAGVALCAFAGWMLVWCAVDRFAHLPGIVRALVLAAGSGAAGTMLLRAAVRWRRRPDWVAAASAAEAHDPRFGQKLVTVTSQVLAAPGHRGSAQILSRLAGEVGEQLALGRGPRLAGAGAALLPWAALAVFAALLVGLARAPGLQFGRLAVRFLQPLADVPPVTTTRLTVSPGDADLVQSQPLTVEARAQQLGDSPVTLYLSDNDRDWSAATMSPAGGGAFAFSLPSVDRDVRYFVSAGDARSRQYTVRVLRRPAVTRFNVRYEYPPYTRLPPANVSNDDGRIEAPVGTRVTLAVTASEPLQNAWLSIEGRRTPTEATADPEVRQAVLTVTSGVTYSVDMVSTRNVVGNGPATCVIRALPDLPPQVRLARGGESLSLAPRSVVPVSYEALDDYGISRLVVRGQLNAGPPLEKPLTLWGDPRRQQEVSTFDLTQFPQVHIGDVVTLTVAALDTGGHEAVSPPLRVLVARVNVDLDTYQRIVELQRAARLAADLAAELAEATRLLEQSTGRAGRGGAGPAGAVAARADRALSSASQTAAMLRQALLRAVTHAGNGGLPAALGAWVDAAETMSAAAQEAFRQGGAAPAGPTVASGLRDAGDLGRRVASAIETVARAEQARALELDLENLAAAAARPSAPDNASRERIAQTLERMRQDAASEARQLGLDAAAPDARSRLAQIVAAGDAVVAATRPVDFAAAAEWWAGQMRSNPQQRLAMDVRLSSAAQAEAVRADADLIRARDLELASRAATTVAAVVRGGHAGGDAMLAAFAGDVRALASVAPRRDATLHEPTELEPRLERARQDLARLAGGGGGGGATTAPATGVAGADLQRDAEDLAMRANAAAASRQYAQASAFEETLLRRLRARPRRDRSGPGRPAPAASEPADSSSASVDRIERRRLEAQRNTATAQRLDDLDQRQQQLAKQLAGGGGGGGAAAELAERQRGVADEIAGVQRRAGDEGAGAAASSLDQPNSRERATAEVLGAIEELAAMPQALAEAQAAASARRDAVRRLAAARDAARAAGVEQREAAERAADEAKKAVDDAYTRLTNATRPLAADPARNLAGRLAAYAPETDAARDVMLAQLVPALAALSDSLPGANADEVDRAASDTREALRATQRELVGARDLLVKRDPLVAARWFARAAAESLSLSPPDLGNAQRHQAGVFESLSRAWDLSIHRAAAERLAVVPSLSSVLGPPPPGDRGQAGLAPGNRFSNAREWGRLRDEGPELDSAIRDTEPSGYEQSLKLYFEALGRAGEGK